MEEAAAKFLAKAEAEIDEEHQKYIDGKANFDESIHEQDDMDPKEFEKEHDGARESHKSRVNKFTRI